MYLVQNKLAILIRSSHEIDNLTLLPVQFCTRSYQACKTENKMLTHPKERRKQLFFSLFFFFLFMLFDFFIFLKACYLQSFKQYA
jgi:hypothetical protein